MFSGGELAIDTSGKEGTDDGSVWFRCLRSSGKKSDYKNNDRKELLLWVINALEKDNKN